MKARSREQLLALIVLLALSVGLAEISSVTSGSIGSNPPNPLQITTASLPAVQWGIPYQAARAAKRQITGTPRATSQFCFTVRRTDSALPPRTATGSLALSVSTTPALDQYGGFLAKPSPSGATGYFRVEKFENRWMLVTPAGNAFWMLAVQNIGDYFYPGTAKFPGGKAQWARQVRRRLKSWGFNTVGEYGARDVLFGTADQMPFMFNFRPASNAIRNTGGFALEAVKEIYSNIPTSTYNGYRGVLLDSFDPKYPRYATAFFNSEYNLQWIPGRATNPWLIGYATEDGDDWFGLTVGSGPDSNVIKPHPAWAVLVSRDPTLSSVVLPGGYGSMSYKDLTNYSKLALRDFLKARYNNDLNAFNLAWASSYTSWDHHGGYGVGTGLLDEGGQHTWVAQSLPAAAGDWNTLNAMTPKARQDMDAFLEWYTERFASVAVKAIRAQDRHHLIFSPDTMNQWGYVSRTPVLRAVAKWFDVLHMGYQEGPIYATQRLAAPGQTYDITGKPMVYWVGLTANKDSSMWAYPDPFGVDSCDDQSTRGQKYGTYVSHLLNAQGKNGDYPSVGMDFWGWADQSNEHANWGLVSLKDNAYDGREAVITPGVDPWGFPTGGEKKHFGDFLGAVRRANLGVQARLLNTARSLSDRSERSARPSSRKAKFLSFDE